MSLELGKPEHEQCSCMKIFKVLLSPAYTVRFEVFNVYQKKFFEKRSF